MEGWDENGQKPKNTLPLYGNKDSMNLNSMILTNVVGSPYFKEELIQYKTFHEVVDEIYYKVDHLEPWEKNSRKLAGQVGMCAGVRGVAAGGIVSTAFCLLYKMFTLKLTRKQLTALLNHQDSPYIRGIGFLYIRYCQPPPDFWNWFSPYIEDEEEIDLKAGGGYSVTIGEMCRMMLSKLDWFGTLFPRLPVNVQKDLEEKVRAVKKTMRVNEPEREERENRNGQAQDGDEWGEAARRAKEDRETSSRGRSPRRRSRERRDRSRDRSRERRKRSRSDDRKRSRSRDRRRSRSRDRKRSRSRSRDRRRRSDSRDRRRSRSRDRGRRSRRSRSNDRGGYERKRSRSRDRSRDRKERRRSRSRERRGRSRSHSRDRRRRH